MSMEKSQKALKSSLNMMIWCSLFRLHLSSLFLLFYGSGSSFWATSLQVSTTHLLNRGWDKKKPLVLWDIIKAGDVWMSVSIPAWQKMEIEQLKINPDTSELALEIIPLSSWKVQADTAQQRTCARCGNGVMCSSQQGLWASVLLFCP